MKTNKIEKMEIRHSKILEIEAETNLATPPRGFEDQEDEEYNRRQEMIDNERAERQEEQERIEEEYEPLTFNLKDYE